MSAEYREKLRSLHLSAPSRRPDTKTTTDVHDHLQVDVIEHLDDRVDVTVRPDTVQLEVPRPHPA